ncbi:MAG: hypothetical protein IT384_16305 [Deltaproteobacteria bacterium]|nr:hypothetical protein [Deltaproteobacteria bacterium]
MPAGLQSVFADLHRGFSTLGVRWYVFGAQAVIAAGVPRFTADVDVTVELPPGGSRRLLSVLGRRFSLQKLRNAEAFIEQARVIPLVHRSTDIPVDVVLAGPGLEEEMLARVQLRRVGARLEIPFVATTDLVALKVLAGRDKDLEDVRALLRAKPAELSVAKVRAALRRIGALLDDSTLLETFEVQVRHARSRPSRAQARAKRTRSARSRPG